MNKNNTSGYKGVSFEKNANKYRAYITFNKNKIRLGYFSTPQEAYQARLDAEELYKGKNFSIAAYTAMRLHRDTSNALSCAVQDYLINNKGGGEMFLNFALSQILNDVKSNAVPNPTILSIPDEGFQDFIKGTKSLRQIADEENVTIQNVRSKFESLIKDLTTPISSAPFQQQKNVVRIISSK